MYIYIYIHQGSFKDHVLSAPGWLQASTVCSVGFGETEPGQDRHYLRDHGARGGRCWARGCR